MICLKERMNESNVCVLIEGKELWNIRQKTLKGTQYLKKKYKVNESKLFALLTFRSSSGEKCRL